MSLQMSCRIWTVRRGCWGAGQGKKAAKVSEHTSDSMLDDILGDLGGPPLPRLDALSTLAWQQLMMSPSVASLYMQATCSSFATGLHVIRHMVSESIA